MKEATVQQEMGNIVSVIKGVSASGKSSRVYQLLKFFKECGFKDSIFTYVNMEGKTKEVGILFEEIGTLFIGKEYYTGEVLRFQGYDVMTGYFLKSEYFSEFIKETCKNYDIIIEGAGTTQSNRLRPLFLRNELGVDKIFIQYYNYREDQKDEYDKRLILRSGKKADKDTMWDKCRSYNKEYEKSLDEAQQIGGENVFIDYQLFDVPIDDYGIKFLIMKGLEDLVPEFIQFVSDFDYINQNNFERFNENNIQ